MSDCQFQSRVAAYHDGELTAEGRRAVERHLAGCGACAAEVEWLRSVSQTLARRRGPDITPAETRRVHAAVDAASDNSAPDSYPISLYRAAGVLTALAASVLIVSCVWLSELPGPANPGRPQGGVAVAEVSSWERVAITLRVDPLPSGLDGESYLADARLADWVLRGLGGSPGGRPNSNPERRPAHEGP